MLPLEVASIFIYHTLLSYVHIMQMQLCTYIAIYYTTASRNVHVTTMRLNIRHAYECDVFI